jgi:hypothetical protein
MASPTVTAAPPASVRLSIVLWLAAIAAGAAEALVHLLLPNPPGPEQLGIRFALYVVLAALVLALRSGRGAVRWAVVVLLGGIGTVSLVIEPITWLLAGGSPGDFLVTADAATLLAAALRVAHIAAVFAALALLLRPSASAYFRRRRPLECANGTFVR